MITVCGKKVLDGTKDQSGVVWEVVVTAESKKLTSGGAKADNETCEQGYVSHMVTRTDNRWCIPEDLLQLKAVWVRDGSLENLACSSASALL